MGDGLLLDKKDVKRNKIELLTEDRFLVQFAEWLAGNYVPTVQNKKVLYWTKDYRQSEKRYTTIEVVNEYLNKK